MTFIRKLPSGKSQIIKDETFVQILNGNLPSPSQLISDLLDDMDIQVRQQDPAITREALSNAHGDWYEWLLAISAWNTFVNNPSADLAILLPNISQFDVAHLYTQELTHLIEDLRSKVQNVAQVQLITSNPDFVIIKREVANRIIPNQQLIGRFDTNSIAFLNSVYTNFTNSCEFDQILGYISIKTSFRPDRRLQIAHEGSLMKAIYIHLQTRKWVINPPGLKYYAVATSVGNPDRNALRTVATHSITTVSSLPQAAVDDVFEVNSMQNADQVFQQILI
ncbi:Cfr10I/Bse634I family restriction endonuclease [Zobellia sp. B3R18]|uniref:Cfr10I/Bse634I family restriction endonuclease n=1 Tax=Zobellia sp. B3R18 TaxID=2841568 RepID=UPI001C06E8C9|nr:Cfr10I/Bse634I family restriction endonuclease [Zobellia sp. B3R18]MBU2975569.1 Cfr10I/Bse634I family restriction endonuclease [Zobellia sp. B3R18]